MKLNDRIFIQVKGMAARGAKEKYPVNHAGFVDELGNAVFFTVIDFAN